MAKIWSRPSIPNPLHVFEQNLLTAAVIEFGGPAVGAASNSLGVPQFVEDKIKQLEKAAKSVFRNTSALNRVSEQNSCRSCHAASRFDNELRRWGGSKLTAQKCALKVARE